MPGSIVFVTFAVSGRRSTVFLAAGAAVGAVVGAGCWTEAVVAAAVGLDGAAVAAEGALVGSGVAGAPQATSANSRANDESQTSLRIMLPPLAMERQRNDVALITTRNGRLWFTAGPYWTGSRDGGGEATKVAWRF